MESVRCAGVRSWIELLPNPSDPVGRHSLARVSQYVCHASRVSWPPRRTRSPCRHLRSSLVQVLRLKLSTTQHSAGRWLQPSANATPVARQREQSRGVGACQHHILHNKSGTLLTGARQTSLFACGQCMQSHNQCGSWSTHLARSRGPWMPTHSSLERGGEGRAASHQLR